MSATPRITRCKLCAHYMHSEHYGTDFCALHHHAASDRDGCTWGTERGDGQGSQIVERIRQ